MRFPSGRRSRGPDVRALAVPPARDETHEIGQLLGQQSHHVVGRRYAAQAAFVIDEGHATDTRRSHPREHVLVAYFGSSA